MFIPRSGILIRKQMVYDKEEQEKLIKQFLIRANEPVDNIENDKSADYCDCANRTLIKDINCTPDNKESSFTYTTLPSMYFCRMFNLKCTKRTWDEEQELKSKKD